jgi:beta-lactamase regulating signal transducer with metallopeptidase domain
MTPLLDIALTNALLAVPLAAIAAAGTLLRRPALTHILWLLVLLRLFAPPVWRVPLAEWPSSETTVVAELGGPLPAWPEQPSELLRADEPADPPAIADSSPAPGSIAAGPNPPATADSVLNAPVGPLLLATFWLGGTVVIVGLAHVRASAFRRMLRFAEPAPPAWQTMCDRLARRLGLRRGPNIWLVPGTVSPLLWAGFGRPHILLPAEFSRRLDGRRRAALFAHELAHLRRGDHWVRWLELAASAVYWWHPIVWFARRGLRAAEEQCCDAWVVWALPAACRDYADALLDTVDFLSRAALALPPLASGLGAACHLRRRVVMILRGGVPRRLPQSGLLAALVFGIGLLAVMPSRGQAPDERRTTPLPKTADVDDEPRPDPRQLEEAAGRLRRQIRELRDRLAAAEKQLALIENGQLPARNAPPSGGFSGSERPRRPDRGGAPAAPGDRPGPGAPPGADRRADPERRLQELERSLNELRREIEQMRREMRRPAVQPPRRDTPDESRGQ